MPAFKGLVCHGSRAEFDEFDLAFTPEAGSAMSRGFYFTNDIEMGRRYSGGADPYVATVSLENPYELDRDAVTFEERLTWGRAFRPNRGSRERLIEAGYDGVVFREDDYVEVVVFFPEQIENYGRRASFEEVEAEIAMTTRI